MDRGVDRDRASVTNSASASNTGGNTVSGRSPVGGRSPMADRALGRAREWMAGLAGVVATIFIATMVVWPLVAVLRRSLTGVGYDRLVEIVTRPSTLDLVVFTGAQAVVSTVATLVLGLPVAHVLARLAFPGRSVLRAAVIVPFVLPTVVVAAAVKATIDNPVLDSLADLPLPAIVYAHVFFNLAVVVRVVGGYWARLDDRQIEAARMLGASPWRAWWTITLRQLRPVLLGSGLLIFLFSFTSYGVIRVLGGVRTATIETEIHRYAIARAEFDVAAVFAAIQLVVVLVMAWAAARFQRRYSVVGNRRVRLRRPAGSIDRLLIALALAVVAVVQGVPVAGMVLQSIRVGDGFGFDHYTGLFERLDVLPVSAAEAILNSILFAAGATMVAVAVGLAAAVAIHRAGRLGRALEALALVPLGVSAVTLGFGYLVAFTVLDFRESVWLVPLAHGVIGLPFVIAATVPALRSVGPRVREAAAVLGASPGDVWRTIDWPVARRGLLTGAGFAAAVSLGEFGATSFLARGEDSFTAPLVIFRLLSTPGQELRGQALALSVVLGIMVAMLAAVVEANRGDGVTVL